MRDLAISLLGSFSLSFLFLLSQNPFNYPLLALLDDLMNWKDVTRPWFGILLFLKLRFLVCCQAIGWVERSTFENDLSRVFGILQVMPFRFFDHGFNLERIFLAHVQLSLELV